MNIIDFVEFTPVTVYYRTVNPTLTNFMTRVFFSSFFGGKRIFRLKPAASVAIAQEQEQ